MRPLEIALWVAAAAALLWLPGHRGGSGWPRAVAAATVALVLAHVLVEGPRWHLTPLYAVALYVAVAAAWPRPEALGPGTGTALAGLGLLAVAAALGLLLPVFELPKPTGPYPVGTVVLHLVDLARGDPRSGRPDGRRELMVQVWYPAAHAGPPVPYRSSAETTLRTRHLASVRTNSARGTPVAGGPGRHPVVLFSPGTGGRRNHNTTQAEHLASHGFVVVAMDHPFETDLVVFPDGREARAGGGGPDDTTAEDRLAVRVADARFVLDELDRLDRGDPTGLFTDRLRTTGVGMFGHSFGGAVAAEVCRSDPRVAAGVNLDGTLYGEAASKGFGKPFVVFLGDVPVPTPEAIAAASGPAREELQSSARIYADIRRGLAGQRGHLITIRGAKHVNYSDSPLYSPLWAFRQAGSIRPERAIEIANAHLLSFFRKHLKGEDDGLFDAPSPFPEVEIERVTDGDR